MRRFNFFLLFIAIFCSSISSLAQDRLFNYEVKIGQFDKLCIQDNVNVIYRCNPDSTGYAHWRGKSHFDDSFIFSNNNGKLTVQVMTDDVNDPELPTLFLYSDFLTNVNSSSVQTVKVETLSPTASFKATLIGNGNLIVHSIKATKLEGVLNTGNGQLILSGTSTQAKYKMIGTGTIQADAVKAENVTCAILGSGSIGCWPMEMLKVSGLGSTKIYYRGNPDVKKSGGGKLFRIDSDSAN